MEPSRDDLLFVYGTLRRGSDHANAARLARESVWLGQASVAGRLIALGWYPALIPGGAGGVTGDVVRLIDPASSWPWLDIFEGCGPDDAEPHEYRRERLAVSGLAHVSAAMAYVWQRDPAGRAVIASGNWLDGYLP